MTEMPSSIVPFSSCLESLPASGSFLVSQLFASGVQNEEVGLENLGNQVFCNGHCELGYNLAFQKEVKTLYLPFHVIDITWDG